MRCRPCSRSGCWPPSATPARARTATRGAAVLILRFENEAEELLHYLKEVGLHPGLEGTVERSADDGVVVSSDRGRHTVSRSVAETVSVRADPSPAPRPPLPEQLVLSSDRYGR